MLTGVLTVTAGCAVVAGVVGAGVGVAVAVGAGSCTTTTVAGGGCGVLTIIGVAGVGVGCGVIMELLDVGFFVAKVVVGVVVLVDVATFGVWLLE